jgi:HK97 gp10 family phage protein
MPIVIDGLAELSEMLTTLTPRAAKRYLSSCGEPAAQVVLDAMKSTVPVHVGILEEELGWQKKFLNDGDETTMEIVIGPLRPAFWGSFQEFGTQDLQGMTKEGKHFHHVAQPAQHWMGRAWESCREECLSVFATQAIGILQDLENKA